MVKTFEFENRALDLCIAGKEFQVNCDADTGAKIEGFFKDGRNWLEEIQKGVKNANEMLGFFKELLDGILGENAFDKIFENRKPNIEDCADVATFILNEVGAEFKRINEKNLNRAQRRAIAHQKPKPNAAIH